MEVLTTLEELINSMKERKYVEDNQLFSILVRVDNKGTLWYRVVYDGYTPDPYQDYDFGDDSDEEGEPDLGFVYFDVDMFGNVDYDHGDGCIDKAVDAYEKQGWVTFHSD